ncbi:MAG: ShlB/FhaC/HecB family hemolysin secretion/activation protein [Pseudomonas putida]|jgi:hemolysin activation/secretion protein|nr:ShlB/FhaC/HecB family hemolysin secretion/activation protein [Pseudomonas putida]
MSHVFSSWLLAAIGFTSLGIAAAPVPVTPGDRDYQRDRQERLLREQYQRLEDLQHLPGASLEQAPVEVVADTRCFDVRSIFLSGADQLDTSTRERLLVPYRGQCLGALQLNSLLKAITDHYLDRGFVTSRAYLPQQDLSLGNLTIVVVEGRLEGFDASSLVSPRELAMSFPGQTGDVLDLRELEQLVDQINRLPSRMAQLELTPGERVGGSRVALTGERHKPWRVSAFRDNSGDSSSGEQQAGLGLDWDSPLGLNDLLGLRMAQDVVSDRWKHSASQGLFYSLPYGWWTFSYSYNQSDYRTRIGNRSQYSGDSQSHRLGAERVLYRDHLSKTAVNVGLSHLRGNNYVDNHRINLSSSHITETQVGLNHGRRLGSAFFNLDAGWQQGIGALDAEGEHNGKSDMPHARYDKYTLTLSYLQPFQLWGERLSFEALATAQKSEDALYSQQRIGVGGLSSVRGFKDQTLTGDSGGYWRNQLRWRRPVLWAPVQPWLQEYGAALAYDVGLISNDRRTQGWSGRMSGSAIEFEARGQYLAASVGFARSLERPSALQQREHPIYFRLDAFF